MEVEGRERMRMRTHPSKPVIALAQVTVTMAQCPNPLLMPPLPLSSAVFQCLGTLLQPCLTRLMLCGASEDSSARREGC